MRENKHRIRHIKSLKLLGLIAFISLASCRNTKYLKPNEVLYTGSKINVQSEKKDRKAKALSKEIVRDLYPKPNKKFLGLRTRLWYYNIAGEVKKDKGLRYWLKNIAGEKPVLLSDVNADAQVSKISANFENKGYFKPDISVKVNEKKKKAEIVYTVSIQYPYIIDKITFPQGDWSLYKAISLTSEKTLIKPGDRYDLDQLKNERERITRELKDVGYFFFNPDHILFKADTAKGNRTVSLSVTVKEEIPYEATYPFKLQNIYVHSNYSLDLEKVVRPGDTSIVEGVHYISRDTLFNPRVIVNSVALKPGNLYTVEDHDLTLNRLTNLGVFKFVNVRFSIPENCEEEDKLDCFVYLTPTFKKSISLELQGVTKSNDFAGPALIAGFRNRNVRRSAQLFVFNFTGAYETQIRNKSSSLHTYELGAETKLFIPRFLTPFNIARHSKAKTPKTQFILGAGIVSRINIFDMSTFKFNYGYTWRETEFKRHELNPVSINYLQLTNTSERFKELLNRNLLLRESFEEQFLIGGTYNFNYNTREDDETRSPIYFNGNIDLSGNMVQLLEKVFLGSAVKKSFGNYSQYARFEADFRYYLRTGEKAVLASRFLSGVGIPYGHSKTLPYIRQFFSGGTNSIRAFPARSLGPGSYRADDSSLGIFNRPGDVKLEFNLEYRFDITRIIKGALFTDAGNVWLIKKNPEFPGGEFNTGKFLKQVAIGAGAGLRLDISFFVLRFDLAIPVKKPHAEDDSISESNTNLFVNKNYILNVAIGYPF